MIDVGKSLKAATVPLAIFVAIGVFASAIGYFVSTLWFIGLLVPPVNAVLVAWAGYKAVKEQGLGILGGAISGLIVGTVGAVVNGIAGTALAFISYSLYEVGAAFTVAAILMGAFVGIAFWVVIGIVGGPILGAVGAYVAGMKK